MAAPGSGDGNSPGVAIGDDDLALRADRIEISFPARSTGDAPVQAKIVCSGDLDAVDLLAASAGLAGTARLFIQACQCGRDHSEDEAVISAAVEHLESLLMPRVLN